MNKLIKRVLALALVFLFCFPTFNAAEGVAPVGYEVGISTSDSGNKQIWVRTGFHDVSDSHWFYVGLQKWRQNGVVVGDHSGNARLDDKITAVEIYTLFVRYIYSNAYRGEEINGALWGDYVYLGHEAWLDAYETVHAQLTSTIQAVGVADEVALPASMDTVITRRQAFILYAMAALSRTKDPKRYLNQFSDVRLGYYAQSNVAITTYDKGLSTLSYFIESDHNDLTPLQIKCANMLMYLGVLNGKPLSPGSNWWMDAYGILDRAEGIKLLTVLDKVDEAPVPTPTGKDDAVPRPYDPDNPTMENIDLEDGFIYGENRGDYAIIEIPTLYWDSHLYDTDNYDSASMPPTINDTSKDIAKVVTRYVFALYDATTDTYTELVEGTDVTLLPYDEDALDAAGDLYNYILGLYNGSEILNGATGKRDFVGSKFLLLPRTGVDGTYTPGGQALYEMLNNEGSLEPYTDGGVTKYRTALFVKAEDAAKRQSAYTQVWIRPWFALGVKAICYGPTHPLTGELYRLQNSSGTDPADFASYETVPTFAASEVVVEGSGKWLQILRIRSSELLGGFDSSYDPDETGGKSLLDNVDSSENLTYALTLKKASNLPYTRVKLELNPSKYTGTEKLADFYENSDASTRTFMLQDTIYLIAGDVDENGKTKIQDYDYVYDFVYRNRLWSDLQAEPVKPAYVRPAGCDAVWDQYDRDMESWAVSVYNPESMAYRCDLTGDRRLSVQDLDIVRTRFNYNRTKADYCWYEQSETIGQSAYVLPFGMAAMNTAKFRTLAGQ